MHYSQFSLPASPSLRLHGWQWLPDAAEPCRGVVCLIHGLGEHSGRYGKLVDHLLRHQYAVAAIDQVGHGRSEGQRGHIVRYDQLPTADRIYKTTNIRKPPV